MKDGTVRFFFKKCRLFLTWIFPDIVLKVVNDEDLESNGESKSDDDESDDDVFGVTTVVNVKKHQVGNNKIYPTIGPRCLLKWVCLGHFMHHWFVRFGKECGLTKRLEIEPMGVSADSKHVPYEC